jgi:hypothetical protein
VKSNAVGLDGIPLKFIKLFLPAILSPITHTFLMNQYQPRLFRVLGSSQRLFQLQKSKIRVG